MAAKTPALAEDFIGIFTGAAGNMNFGFLTVLWTLTGLLYMLGGALFGLATFRAGILPRWAAILLVLGSALAPVATLLPLEYQPKVALPVGIAIAWLGYALWAERREPALESVPGTTSPQLSHTGAK